MDIAEVSMAMAQNNIMTNVGVALLDNSLEQSEGVSAELTKMMELSVNPNVGGNFDMSV